MNKLDMKSKNIVDENVTKIGEFFPNVVVETDKGLEIDFNLLKQELSKFAVDDSKEKYQLTWPGKRESIITANTPTKNTLRPIKEKSVNFDNTENIYIEGDNLEALKILQESYLNKIKCIYIDPPYNTGNDFIYNDKFNKTADDELEESGQVDDCGNRLISNNQSNGRFHSDWLSMMYSRLKLARNLLTEDGVIFISIDENELFNLKRLCDEIFGENNYISTLTIENNPKGRKNSKFISVSSEYCLIYSKNTELAYFIENVPKDLSAMKEDEDGNFVHNSGKRVLVGENFFNKEVTNFSSDKHYTAYYNKNSNDLILKTETDLDTIDVELKAKGYQRYYSYRDNNFVENTYTKIKFREMFNNGELEFKNNKVYGKNLSTTIRLKNLLINKKYKGLVYGEVKEYSMDFKTTSAGTMMKELFQSNDVLFSAPKNVYLIKLLISLIDDKNSICLDFFSGSGTTAHSVMELNSEDGGNRKYILVQVPESLKEKEPAFKEGYNNICDLAEERIRLSANKIKEETNAEIDYGFRVYKIDSSNMKDVYYKPEEIKQQNLELFDANIKEDRTDLDLLTQVILDLGLTLDLTIGEKTIGRNKVYYVDDNSLVACFDDNIDLSVVEEICKDNPLKVVFKDASFNSDTDKINLQEKFKKLSTDTEINIL